MSIEDRQTGYHQQSGDGDPAPSEASERRQLTVLFADLGGSTGLMERLGPEDYSEFLSAYHGVCTDAVREGGGMVAQYQGDGIICYFGFPHASEDDAAHAVSAALNIMRGLRIAQARFPNDKLATRIGISTGQVIIGVDFQHFGEKAVGTCLNRAARLEAMAHENAALICADTRKLVGDLFEFSDLEPQALKGFDEHEKVYRLRGRKTGVAYRFEALRGNSDTPLIGRQDEMATLLARVDKARAGAGQQLAITADAGMGKSKLLSTFRQHEDMENCRVFVLQCSPEHSSTALHPLKSYLDWVAGVSSTDGATASHEKLKRLFTAVWRANDDQLSLLLDLLSPMGSGTAPDEQISVPLRRRMMFEALCEIVFKLGSSSSALVLVVEDSHWIDPSTAEFLSHMVRLGRGQRVFILIASRLECPFVADTVPVEDQMCLPPLDGGDSAELARLTAPDAALSDEAIHALLEKSEGVPLFIEEYLDMAADATSRGRGLDIEAIPLTMNNLIQGKLDLLDADARRFVQTASALGRTFDVEVVKNVSALDDDSVAASARLLVERKLAVSDRREAGRTTYSFTHALVRDAVYASMGRRPRQEMHSKIAAHLTLRGEAGSIGEEIIADHLLRAGRLGEAAEKFLSAAITAAGARNAGEALAHLEDGLNTISEMPDGKERDGFELQLRTIQAPTQMVTRGPGNPDFGATLVKVRELMDRLNSRENIVPIVYNTALHEWARANLERAENTARELMAINHQEPSDSAYLAANTMQGLIAWHQGKNSLARSSLTATVERYDPAIHRDLYNLFLKEFGVFGFFYLDLTETVLGNLDVGAQRAAEAMKVAEIVQRPHAFGFSLLANFAPAMLRGDVETADRYSEQSLAFAENQGFPEFAAMSKFCRGWVACQKTQADAGLPLMAEGAAKWDATGFAAWQPIFAALEARCLVKQGDYDAAARLLDKYDARVMATGELQARAPLLLARAELSGALGRTDEADQLARSARDVAAAQEANLWLDQINAAFS